LARGRGARGDLEKSDHLLLLLLLLLRGRMLLQEKEVGAEWCCRLPMLLLMAAYHV